MSKNVLQVLRICLNPRPLRKGLLSRRRVAGLALAVCITISLVPRAHAEMPSCTSEAIRAIAPVGMTIKEIPNLKRSGSQRTSGGVGYIAANAGGDGAPEHCLVTGSFVTNPRTGKTANFAVALPARQSWNGKFLFHGCAFNCGQIYVFSTMELAKGYPVWATDDGHTNSPVPGSLPSAIDATWAVSSPGHFNDDAVTDFLNRAVYTLTGLGKQFTKKFYAAQRIKFSYFTGCSDGGREGMVELTQHPDDYDGIIAGAPYFDMSNEMMTTLTGNLAELRNQHAGISGELFKTLGRLVRERCDASDGVRDGLIQNPAACAFDPDKDLPKCTAGSDPQSCFTADQIDSLKVIFSAITDANGALVFPGFSFSDADADLYEWLGFPVAPGNLRGPLPWATDPAYQPLGWYWSSEAVKNIIYAAAPDFNPVTTLGITFADGRIGQSRGFHAIIPDSSVRLVTERTAAGSGMRAVEAARFFGMGHKLIMYHGYSDGLITPYRTIQYYRTLAHLHGGYAALRRSAELFMVPGMGHCAGGPGPNLFGQAGVTDRTDDAQRNVLTSLERWVEAGEQPKQLIATKYKMPKIASPYQMNFRGLRAERTMPLCPFPAMAQYRGSGDMNDAANWRCPVGDTRADHFSPSGIKVGADAMLQ